MLLGLGRAFGEAIAVNQTIGNANAIPTSWFEPGNSLGSKIAAEYVGATSILQAGSILYLAAILMVISLATNVVAQFIVLRFERARRAYDAAPAPVDPYDVTARSSGLRRRRLVEKLFGGARPVRAIACAILGLVLGTVIYKGFSQLDLTFFTEARPLFGEKGGIADALIGSALIVGMAMLMAIPISVSSPSTCPSMRARRSRARSGSSSTS